MKCTFCGADLEGDAKFCTNCGKTVEAQAQQAAPMTQPVQQQPAVAPVVPTQQPTQQVVQQPVQQKKNNTVWIVLGVVFGVLLIFVIGIALLFGAIFSSVVNEVSNSSIYDYSDDGEVIKKVTDPMGREIIIESDSIYLVHVDTSYLYDVADEMKEKAKIGKKEDVSKLNATDKQKEATNKVISLLSGYGSYTKEEIEDELKDDGYDLTTIQFALENCGVDWDERATIEAFRILAAGGFSKEETISLMVFEGYTKEEAEKAANNKELDYYEQAVYDACFLKYTEKEYSGSYTRAKAEESLRSSGYTEEEIKFALKTVYDEMDD